MTKSKMNQTNFFCTSMFCALLLITHSPVPVLAANKTIVVPLFEDDRPSPPFKPIRPESTENNYTSGPLVGSAIFDDTEKLLWEKQSDSTLRDWYEAQEYCDELIINGYGGWRLPNLQELLSLVDFNTTSQPRINQVAFSDIEEPEGSSYWTNTVVTRNIATGSYWAHFVNFWHGTSDIAPAGFNRRVRCVRDQGS